MEPSSSASGRYRPHGVPPFAKRTEGASIVQISFRGDPLHLTGTPPQPGEPAREFTMHRFTPEEGMVEVTLADLPAKPRLLSVVPSLDTPVCSDQTRAFDEKLAGYGERIAAYTISVDLPFAQRRFCDSEGTHNTVMLSDYKTRSFGTTWGTLVEESQLLARAVFVLDADGIVTYSEVVPDISHEPDYDSALRALDLLVSGSSVDAAR
jgi:thiol peroxidase